MDEKELHNRICKGLVSIMKEENIPQKELAEWMGCTPEMISNLFAYRRQFSIYELVNLCSTHDYSIVALLEGRAEKVEQGYMGDIQSLMGYIDKGLEGFSFERRVKAYSYILKEIADKIGKGS